MTGGKDPACRRTMIWDEEKQDHDLRETLQRLIHIRNTYPVFRCGTFEPAIVDDAAGVYGFMREDPKDGTRALVVLNNGDAVCEVNIQIHDAHSPHYWRWRWASDDVRGLEISDNVYRLQPQQGVIFIGGITDARA
jgi:pullulanase/glycogen debranching enzyme